MSQRESTLSVSSKNKNHFRREICGVVQYTMLMSCSHHNKVTSWRQYRFAWQYQFRVWSVKTISTRNILALKYNSNMDSVLIPRVMMTFQRDHKTNNGQNNTEESTTYTKKRILENRTVKLVTQWVENIWLEQSNIDNGVNILIPSNVCNRCKCHYTSSDIVHITWHTASSHTHT